MLKGTTLDIRVDDIRMLAPDLALVATSERGSRVINVVKRLENGAWKLTALRVTRSRPIHGGLRNVLLWGAFDRAWSIFV